MITVENPAQFTVYARFTSVDAAKNRQRFYTIAWQPALWGGWAVVKSWGRLGTTGRSLASFYPDRANAQGTIQGMVRRRLERGYQLMECK